MLKKIIIHLYVVAALLSAAIATGFAAPPALTVRQNHLLFQFAHEAGRAVCAVQEIVVVENGGESVYENPAGTVRLSVPTGAERISVLPVPDIMPGGPPDEPLRPEEFVISSGEILIKRPLRPGKNTFSYGYMLVADHDVVLLEKKVLLKTRLVAAFAPPVGKLTSGTLPVEKSEEGYRILGHDLQAGASIDLHFEGIHAALSGPAGGSESASPSAGMESRSSGTHPPSHSSSAGFTRYAAPASAGILLAVLVVLYLSHVKKSRAAAGEFRQFLMDELEVLDESADRKEIPAEYHKRRKKALMDRLRSMS